MVYFVSQSNKTFNKTIVRPHYTVLQIKYNTVNKVISQYSQ